MLRFDTLLLGSTGLTGANVLRRLISPWSYLPVLHNEPFGIDHHILVVTRKGLDIQHELDMMFGLLECNGSFKYSCEIGESTLIHYNWHDGAQINIYVHNAVEAESQKWEELVVPALTRIQTGNDDTPHYDNSSFSIISCLGSTANTSKKSGIPRDWVDNTLNVNILSRVLEEKDLRSYLSQYIIITSFNNFLLSTMLPYFRTKATVETRIQELLIGSNASLTILQPGPLIGCHGPKSAFISPAQDDDVLLLSEIINYKKAVFQHYMTRIQEWKKVGLKTRASELIANASYRMPGASIIGYPVKSSDCANLIVHLRINHALYLQVEKKVVRFTSQEIDLSSKFNVNFF